MSIRVTPCPVCDRPGFHVHDQPRREAMNRVPQRYALWAPGVGYMREVFLPNPYNPAVSTKFTYELAEAALFPSVTSLLESVTDGRVRGFEGYEIRKIATRTTIVTHEDLGEVR